MGYAAVSSKITKTLNEMKLILAAVGIFDSHSRVGASRGCFAWVLRVGASRGCFAWVLRVGASRG
jgi:hypothetical protein